MMRNPVFESSLKRRMRTWRTPMLLTLYVAFLLLVCFAALSVLQQGGVTLGNLRTGLETYIYISVMQFALIVLVAPALTSGAISGERERQTLDLLLCTRVGAVRIVLGKLLSNVCFLALVILSSLPMMAITLQFGGVGIGDMLFMQLFLFITAIVCCSIGIFCSALFKRTVTATVVSYLVIFAIGVGTIVFPFLFQNEQIVRLVNYSVATSSMYGGGVAIYGATASASTAAQEMSVPLLLYLNPALGLASLLIEQTGLLRNTFESYLGYRGNELYSLISLFKSLAPINMVVMLAVSVVIAPLSALFIKPLGHRGRRHK